MFTSKGTLRLSPALCLLVAVIGASSMVVYHLGFFIPRMLAVRSLNGGGNGYSFGDDFYPVWLTSRQAGLQGHNLYSAEMTRKIQIGLFGRPLDARNPKDPPEDYRQFAYPAFTDLLLWPASLVDFPLLRVILAILLPLLTVISIRFWMLAVEWRVDALRFAAIVVLTLCSYELLEAFFAEQPGLLVGFCLAGAALAVRRNKLLLAGILLSVCLIKPQITVLAGSYLILWSSSDRRRAHLWIGFCCMTACLLAASCLLWPHWLIEWIRILSGYHRYAMPPLVAVLLGPTLDPRYAPIVIGVLLLASAHLAWRKRHARAESADFWLTLSLLLAITSFAILPGQAVYDHFVLIPGVFLLLQYGDKLHDAGRVPRALQRVGILVLLWQFVAAFILLCLHAFAIRAFNSYVVFSLPIRTAASLPFVVFALLVWTWHLNVKNQAPS